MVKLKLIWVIKGEKKDSQEIQGQNIKIVMKNEEKT